MVACLLCSVFCAALSGTERAHQTASSSDLPTDKTSRFSVPDGKTFPRFERFFKEADDDQVFVMKAKNLGVIGWKDSVTGEEKFRALTAEQAESLRKLSVGTHKNVLNCTGRFPVPSSPKSEDALRGLVETNSSIYLMHEKRFSHKADPDQEERLETVVEELHKHGPKSAVVVIAINVAKLIWIDEKGKPGSSMNFYGYQIETLKTIARAGGVKDQRVQRFCTGATTYEYRNSCSEWFFPNKLLPFRHRRFQTMTLKPTIFQPVRWLSCQGWGA